MQAILLVAAVAAAAAVPQYDSPGQPAAYEPFDPPKYEFEYSVKDYATVNDYGQQEARDGSSTAGSYEVRLPDTRLQRVVYSVDGDSGFVADVEFDGQAQHPGEHGGGSVTSGRSYSAPAQDHVRPRAHTAPEPTPSYRPAPSPPTPSYRPVPRQPKTSYSPAPSPPKTSYRPAPRQPKTSYSPAPSPPKTSYSPAPSPPKTSYNPAPSRPQLKYSPAAKTTSAPEPSVYGSKKLKFESVPSDVYDKPLFRADYERAVHSRGGSGGARKKQAAPARYGPSAVLIDSDDDRYIVPDTPAVPGLQKLLSAPWVSYRKAVDSYLAKEDKAGSGDAAGSVVYGGGRHEDDEASDSSEGSSVPYGARIAPKPASGGDDYPSYKTVQ